MSPITTRAVTAGTSSLTRLKGLRRHLSNVTMPPSGPIAIVAGVGGGTGGSVARRFAKKYPTLLLARSAKSYEPLVAEIEKAGGTALGIATDVTSSSAIKAAIDAATQKWHPGASVAPIAAAIFNAPGQFRRAPFQELTEADFANGLTTGATSGFIFAQAVLPGLLAQAEARKADELSPTLIFTGATASVKGSARFASFAAAKFALRALSQSLAREFMPQGVHVSHSVVDGVIDAPHTKSWNVGGEDSKMDPEAIAESYWQLHAQPKNTWTVEIDLRPWVEKW